jgi:peptidoglycan/xylan/chitin deacetylase (PgdA/CDA1 family)
MIAHRLPAPRTVRALLLPTLLTALLTAPSAGAQGAARRAPDSLRVPILVYHNIEPWPGGKPTAALDLTMRPEAFARQMAWLAEHRIPVVSMSALLDALEGKATLPPKAVVITFDDGRVNQYHNAVPVLRKHGFTATFFPFVHAQDKNPRYFSWAQFREIMAAGMSVGSHGVLHVRVDKVTGPKLHEEVTGSRETLRAKLGAPATEFYSYPFGALAAAGDSAVRAAGYRAGRAYGGGAWNSLATRWRLRSVPMTESMRTFIAAVDPTAPLPPPARRGG